MKDDIRSELDKRGETYTPSDIDAAFGVVIGVVVVFGLIGVILWLWMAAKNNKGKNWARITATVLAGINIMFSLLGSAGEHRREPRTSSARSTRSPT